MVVVIIFELDAAGTTSRTLSIGEVNHGPVDKAIRSKCKI